MKTSFNLARWGIALTMICLFNFALASNNPPSLELIMSNSDWMGHAPEDAYFSDNGQKIYYQIQQNGSHLTDWFEYTINTASTRKLSDREAYLRDNNVVNTEGLDRGETSPDKHYKVFEKDQDIFLKDLQSQQITHITQTSEDENQPRFLQDESKIPKVLFWKKDTLFMNQSGQLSELTQLIAEDEPKNKPDYSYLDTKQQAYFETLREIHHNKKLVKQRDKTLPKFHSRPFYLGADTQIIEKLVNPSGEFVVLVVQEKSYKSGPEGKLARFVTDSGYIDIETVRTRVGQNPLAPQYLMLLDLNNHTQIQLPYDALEDIHKDRLFDERKAATKWHMAHGASKEKAEELTLAPNTRAVTISNLQWSTDGMSAAVMLRAIDNKDRWIATLDLKTGRLKQQHQLTDQAWINWDFNEMGWLKNSHTLWYLSEESGFSHLYLRDTLSRKTRQITQGKWEVSHPVPTQDGQTIYFRANVEHPGKYEIYAVDVKTKKMTPITHLGGNNDFQLAGDEKHLLINHSTNIRQNEIYLKDLTKTQPALAITDTMSAEYKAIDWLSPEIVDVPSSHVKQDIKAKFYKPKDFDPSKKYPAVFFVHGAGYLQNSDLGWSYYYHEMMFHTLLVNQGYLVLDMDYRGSAGYGRDWRTAIYRNMGHPEVEDLKDGVNWLAKNWSVDPKKVGVYGGSYGGFLTYMSLFTEPDLFAAGAALRPVADWSHYNHEYSSNILNTPNIDPIAYERSSPIEYVDGLKKPLLIMSGMLDDNVFFQDSIRIVQALIEHKNPNFQLAVYPMERHSFHIASSWLDEYRRIYKLMNENLK